MSVSVQQVSVPGRIAEAGEGIGLDEPVQHGFPARLVVPVGTAWRT